MLDPLDKPFLTGLEGDDNRSARSIQKLRGNYDELTEVMRQVRLADLRLVDRADFLIVKLDMDVQMAGTYEEIFVGNSLKRPVLIWCPQGVDRIPDWLFGCLDYREFFSTLEDLLAYLDGVAEGSIEPSGRRWRFFNHTKMFPREVIEMFLEASEDGAC